MNEPQLKPKQIRAGDLRPQVHRLQVGDIFFLVQRIDQKGDLEGTRDVERVIARWDKGEGEDRWQSREFGVDERVTVLPRVLFKIPMHRLGELKKKVEKLNKRAARRNLTPIYFEELEEVVENVYHWRSWAGERMTISEERYLEIKKRDPYDTNYWKEVRVYKMVKVIGETPHYNGWRAIAVLEHIGAGTLVHAIGDNDVPEKYREASNFCDHCKTKRKRKKTLVICHDNGSTKRIGLNCAADFVGIKSASELVGSAELWEKFFDLCGGSEEGGWLGREPQEFGILEYLPWVAQSIRQLGWVPRSRAGDSRPTADDALWLMIPPLMEGKGERKEREERGAPMEIDFQRAEKGLEWARTLTDTSDFAHNVRVLSSVDWFHRNKAGFIACFVQGYLRELEKDERWREDERGAGESPSEWVGNVGDKVEIEAVCTNVKTIRGKQWDSIMYRFLDDRGNRLVWFTSTSFSLQEWVAEGRTYSIRASVKSHDEYKGIKQTKLTRATFPDIKKAKKDGTKPEEYLEQRLNA